jgi:hypothetical protein
MASYNSWIGLSLHGCTLYIYLVGQGCLNTSRRALVALQELNVAHSLYAFLGSLIIHGTFLLSN